MINYITAEELNVLFSGFYNMVSENYSVHNFPKGRGL